MNNMFRVGCIGTGSISNTAHIPAFVSLHKEFRIVAIYDSNPKNAESTKSNYIKLMNEKGITVDWDIHLTESAEELLQQVDVVDICTSLRFHSYYAALALKHNVHAMSEKPMARTWWESTSVVEAAKNTNSLFQLNDDNLFIPRYLHVKNVIESGMLGDIQQIFIARGKSSSDRSSWFFDPIEAGGGSVLDYGTHAVTSTWFMIGFDKIPQEVRSLGIRVKDRTRIVDGQLKEINVDDDAHFKIRYLNPLNGDWINVVIEATWSWPELGKDGSDVRGYIEVQGSEGTATLVFDEDDQEFIKITNRMYGERWLPIKSYASEDLSFEDELYHFYKTLVTGSSSLLDAEKGAMIVKLINCAQLSELRERKSITPGELEEFTNEIVDGIDDFLVAGDKISKVLNKPYASTAS
ncbi:Gfo/Idh/MocA family protein [Fredinandcohnia sp. 179-A 10B2 NHS]|uniref:Gfo/Idh/MocA family protein n=1 Tax=Fredinandcohnia sp. 179-A 10B2 NHS TaxID=3235176 RepID=UPI0039A0B387